MGETTGFVICFMPFCRARAGNGFKIFSRDNTINGVPCVINCIKENARRPVD